MLVSMLEEPEGKIVEDSLDASDRDAFLALREYGMITAAQDAPWILCPWCGEHDIEPRRTGKTLQGLCPECGHVPITNASLKAWSADPKWLLDQLRLAFGIASRQISEELVPGTLWKVGDLRQNRKVRRILFARRLSDHATNQAFRAALVEKVERDTAVIVGTTSKSVALVNDLSSPYVHLAEIVHLRSGKLELDKNQWDWCLKPTHLRGHDASTVFFENFRLAVLDGEEYEFSVHQGAVFSYLHAARGGKCHKDSIMEDIDSSQKNPVEIFRHNPRQMEGFQRTVEWNDFGFYWLKPCLSGVSQGYYR